MNRKKNENSLKLLSKATVSLICRFEWFSACIKLNWKILHQSCYCISNLFLVSKLWETEREKERFTSFRYSTNNFLGSFFFVIRLWSTSILWRWYFERSVGLWWSDSGWGILSYDDTSFEVRSPISSTNLSHFWADDALRIWQSHRAYCTFPGRTHY